MPLKKYLKFYFGLKYPKMATTEGDHEIASVRVLKSMSLFTFQKCPSVPRIALLFPKSVLLFPGIALFFFPEVFFCFPEVPFYFSKIPYCFREFPFSFPEVPSIYLLCTSFSFCSELIREIIFTLLLFYFLMEPFNDQLMMPSR